MNVNTSADSGSSISDLFSCDAHAQRLSIGTLNQRITDVAISTGIIGKIWTAMGLSVPTAVVINGQEQTLYVKISSLAKRLGISKNTAKELLANPENLKSLIRTMAPVAMLINQSKIISSAAKTVKPAITELFNDFVSLCVQKALNKESIDSVALTDRKFILIRKGDNLSLIEKGDAIAEGRFGRIDGLKKKSDTVIKTAKASGDQSIQREYNILKEINPRGDVEGIQLPPHSFVCIDEKGFSKGLPSYLAPLYTENLFSHEFVDKEGVISAFSQLQKGVQYLHSMEINHGDIKPENILVKDSRYDLADFGGVIKTSEVQAHLTKIAQGSKSVEDLMTHFRRNSTKEFCPPTDESLLRNILNGFAKELGRPSGKNLEIITSDFSKRICDVLKARDAYALGLSILDKINSPFLDESETLTHPSNSLGDPNYWRNVGNSFKSLGFEDSKINSIINQLYRMTYVQGTPEEAVAIRLEALKSPLFG